MTKKERDPRIEPPHCFLIFFPDGVSRLKVHTWLNAVSDVLILVEGHILQIKIELTETRLAEVIRNEGIGKFSIYELDDFEVEDKRTDNEKLNEILDKIVKYGFENITLEDRLRLIYLSERV